MRPGLLYLTKLRLHPLRNSAFVRNFSPGLHAHVGSTCIHLNDCRHDLGNMLQLGRQAIVQCAF